MQPIQQDFGSFPKAPGITAVVLTCNGERLLDRCLSSLSFCDVLLLVDSGSTDTTAEIAKKHGAAFVHHAWEGFDVQFAYAQTLVQTRWFFIVDQDEICPPALAVKIRETVEKHDAVALVLQERLAVEGERLLASPVSATVGFSVGRKSWYFDRFLLHSGWYPDHISRLFCTGFVSFYQDAHIHYDVHGQVEHVGGAGAELIHYPYSGFFNQVEKINVYAEQGATASKAEGKKGSVFLAVGHGMWRFFRLYVLKAGFLDGRAGFIVAAHGAFYAFAKHIRVIDSSWGAPFDKE